METRTKFDLRIAGWLMPLRKLQTTGARKRLEIGIPGREHDAGVNGLRRDHEVEILHRQPLPTEFIHQKPSLLRGRCREWQYLILREQARQILSRLFAALGKKYPMLKFDHRMDGDHRVAGFERHQPLISRRMASQEANADARVEQNPHAAFVAAFGRNTGPVCAAFIMPLMVLADTLSRSSTMSPCPNLRIRAFTSGVSGGYNNGSGFLRVLDIVFSGCKSLQYCNAQP